MGKEQRASHLAPHLEVFAKAVAEGSSHVQAAVTCGRSRGSASNLYARPGVQERIAELLRVVQSANESAVIENAIRIRRPITIDRNDVINGLAHEARTAKSACARVSAWNALADILMLRATGVAELKNFIGWTDDEIEQLAATGLVPDRISILTGASRAEDLRPKSGERSKTKA